MINRSLHSWSYYLNLRNEPSPKARFINWIWNDHKREILIYWHMLVNNRKKGKRKVQGVRQSQTAALPRPQEEEETDNLNKHKPNKRTKSTKISSLFPKRGNRNTKRTEKHKNKMTHGKTYNKSPRRINHKATKNDAIFPLLYFKQVNKCSLVTSPLISPRRGQTSLQYL